MEISEIFYRWEHTPECRLAWKKVMKLQMEANRASKKLTKSEDSSEKDKVLIQGESLNFSQILTGHSEAAEAARIAHLSCEYVPRFVKPPTE